MSTQALSPENAANVAAAAHTLNVALTKLADAVAADTASENPLLKALANRITLMRDALRPLPMTTTSDIPAQEDEENPDLTAAITAVGNAIDAAQGTFWLSVEPDTEDLAQALSRLSDLASAVRRVREASDIS